MPESRAKSPPPHQLLMAFDSTLLRGMSATERRHAATCLAALLVEASGVGTEEQDNDQQ